jgi:hypothetical protein
MKNEYEIGDVCWCIIDGRIRKCKVVEILFIGTENTRNPKYEYSNYCVIYKDSGTLIKSTILRKIFKTINELTEYYEQYERDSGI